MTDRDDYKRLNEAGLEAAVRECARITAPEISDEEFAQIKADNSPLYQNTRVEMARAITAYLSAASVKAGEVVAWRAFCPETGGEMVRSASLKGMLVEEAENVYAEHGYELQPLYITPTASVGAREACQQVALDRATRCANDLVTPPNIRGLGPDNHALEYGKRVALEIAHDISALVAANQSDGGVQSGVRLPPKDFARVCSAIHAAKDVLRGYAKIEYDTDNHPQPNGAFEVEQQCKEALYTLDECNAGFPPSRREPSDTPPAPQAVEAVSVDALADIAAERKRQREVEGWTPEHDDGRNKGELAAAAACYTVGRCIFEGSLRITERGLTRNLWPWSLGWWKPKDRRRNLVRAAALIIAEIERLDRRALLAKFKMEERP